MAARRVLLLHFGGALVTAALWRRTTLLALHQREPQSEHIYIYICVQSTWLTTEVKYQTAEMKYHI